MHQTTTPLRRWKQTPFTSLAINGGFWETRLHQLRSVTLRACLDQCEKTGRIANFAKAGGLQEGPFQGIYYDDSDVYKVIEGAAYALMHERDPKLEAEVDGIIQLIVSAQQQDGYLMTFYTLQEPDRKWVDMANHEMYCGGHLMEAAVAYYEATGKRELLDAACRVADHIDERFGPGKRHWAEGHEEIELALVRLYRATGEERYWKLALWLLEERGHGHGVGYIWDKEEWGASYCQDDVPVQDIREVKGHAVRAMYLYTAMADVTLASGDTRYIEALNAVWSHTVERNMYVTGGIGPSHHNEGFTHDYDLPNESAYCETCAAIAMAFWNHRMNLLFGDAKYADVIEREMYNGALAGLSQAGDAFFYVNPLASRGDHHRVAWFGTSCCPTNMARFLPSVGNYAYAQTEDGIAVNQYVSNTASLKAGATPVRIEQQTEYPWNGTVALTVEPEREEQFTIRLRIPGWCRGYRITVNGNAVMDAERTLDKGYLVLDRTWQHGDAIVLAMDMPVQPVKAKPEVTANAGKIAIARGPVVYCAEEADNGHLVYESFAISSESPFAVEQRSDLLGGIVTLSGKTDEGKPVQLIPYFAWDNRTPGFMQVWMKEGQSSFLYI